LQLARLARRLRVDSASQGVPPIRSQPALKSNIVQVPSIVFSALQPPLDTRVKCSWRRGYLSFGLVPLLHARKRCIGFVIGEVPWRTYKATTVRPLYLPLDRPSVLALRPPKRAVLFR
jgi:hypothetical protein